MGSGKLLGLLGALIYVVFTLLPDSSTQMLSWTWVIIWQAGLVSITSVSLLNLWQREKPFFLLGNNLDWAIALFFISICLSTIFAEFPNQAVWQSLIALGIFNCIYVIFNYLKASNNLDKLVSFQAILGLVVIVESLGLWIFQTLLPELNRLSEIAKFGVNLEFDFSNIELRNWAPFGHQNYVAGYLLLVIPLLVVKAINQTGTWRKVWIVGIILGLIDLYTTSSRGGFLGLVIMLIAGLGLLLWQSSISKFWLFSGTIGAIALLSILISFNNRLLRLITGIISGSSEFFYRQITAFTGWQMGAAHIPVGAGLGSVPMLYQKYRPVWADREAEMVFQLHSTPIQIWAELGVLGAIASVITLGLLINLFVKFHRSEAWRVSKSDRVITYGIFAGLLGNGISALTDYQLDIFAISGSLAISFALLAYLGQAYIPNLPEMMGKRLQTWVAGIATLGLFAAIAWLTPVDIAWQASSTGFIYLERARSGVFDKSINSGTPQENLNKFSERLLLSSQLAPWESYYPYQLGWNLGEIGVENRVIPLQKQGLEWLQKGIAANPYQEFGYNNAAWLSLGNKLPQQAETYFRKALELVPTKRSLNFGLGISLLQQNKVDAGLEAISNELKQDPIFITSPFWQIPQWQVQLPKIISNWQGLSPTQSAAINWWVGKTGNKAKAINQLKNSQNPTAVNLATALEAPVGKSQITKPVTLFDYAIAVWSTKDQTQRQKFLETAWILKYRTVPNQQAQTVITALIETMKTAKSFDQWLRQPLTPDSPLILRSRRTRQGFNVLSRHTDGATPQDFFTIQENAIIQLFLADLFL